MSNETTDRLAQRHLDLQHFNEHLSESLAIENYKNGSYL